MNLFKKDPKVLFELIAAIVTVAFSFYLILYFMQLNVPKTPLKKAEVVVTETGEVVDFSEFMPLHVTFDAPSYMMSNFDINPAGNIYVYFNQPVFKTDLVKRLVLKEKSTGNQVLTEIDLIDRATDDSYGAKVNGKWKDYWRQTLIIKPETLKPNQIYLLEIYPNFRDRTQQVYSKKGLVMEFTTADLPGLLNTNIDENTGFLSSIPLRLTFKSPMSKDLMQSSLTITPEVKDMEITVQDKIVSIKGVFVNSETYTLNIPSQTKDIYNRELPEDISLTFNGVLGGNYIEMPNPDQ